jgi:hypothetical protein
MEDYNKYIAELHQINQDRLKNEHFIKMADLYNSTEGEIQKIMSPTHHSSYYSPEPFSGVNRHYHQLEKGVLLLLEYEKMNKSFDMCMRMRFDTKIVDPFFYPHVPETNKITFNESIRAKLYKTMSELKLSSIQEYAQFLKENQITVPNYITKYDPSFGCYFFNNYISLENLVEQEDVLYAFVDHVIFGKRNVFIQLQHLFRDYALIESSLNQKGMQAFFCPEVQLLIYCFHHHINPLMYTHHSLFEMIR